jgi:hypothetical protein
MTDQHTPGPWSSDTDAYVVNNSDEVLADVFYVESHSPDLAPRLIRKANARLIAAAPDLLAALETILNPSPHYGATKAHRDHIEAARAAGLAAIAKARGQ